MNLILALIWLVLGVSFLALYWLDPDAAGAWQRQGVFGYVALALFVYNMLRWLVRRRQHTEPPAQFRLSRRRDEPAKPVNTSFQLADQPPPARRPDTDIRAGEPPDKR